MDFRLQHLSSHDVFEPLGLSVFSSSRQWCRPETLIQGCLDSGNDGDDGWEVCSAGLSMGLLPTPSEILLFERFCKLLWERDLSFGGREAAGNEADDLESRSIGRSF